MLESRPEQGVETDEGVTGKYALQVTTYMPLRTCVCLCVWLYARGGWKKGWGVTVIYVVTYQMKQEGCVNQRVNTQLDISI